MLTLMSLSPCLGILYWCIVPNDKPSGYTRRGNQITNNVDIILPALELASNKGDLEDQHQAFGERKQQCCC